MKSETKYLLTDQWGNTSVTRARSPRKAVITKYALSPHPSITKMYAGTSAEPKAIGYVIGQGHGTQPAWVMVEVVQPATIQP